jgi:hypothetical protein
VEERGLQVGLELGRRHPPDAESTELVDGFDFESRLVAASAANTANATVPGRRFVVPGRLAESRPIAMTALPGRPGSSIRYESSPRW